MNPGVTMHPFASMVRTALDELPLAELDILLVENVGNLICPASFSLGTHATVLVASVPEGDDKPFKYPKTYRGVDVLVLNKMDLLPHVTFDVERFRSGAWMRRPGVAPKSCCCAVAGAGTMPKRRQAALPRGRPQISK